jgi:ATP-dependent Lon protease
MTTLSAAQVPVLPIAGKVLFPRTYLRLTVTSASGLQLLKDLVWDVQAAVKPSSAAARRSGGSGVRSASTLTLALFTTRPPSGEPKQPGDQATSARTASDASGAAPSDLFDVGTLAKIVQLTRVQGSNGLTILVQGLDRVRLGPVVQTTPYMTAQVETLQSTTLVDVSVQETCAARLKELTQTYMELTKSGTAVLRKTQGVINAIGASSIGELADVVASYVNVGVAPKQRVLEAMDTQVRCDLVMELLEQEIEKATLQKKIASEVQGKLEGSRREFLLRQQLEAIKKELGEGDDDASDGNDAKMLEDRISKLKLDAKAEKVALRELRRLKNMSPNQPEYSILHNYLEFFTELPWDAHTQDSLVVRDVQKQLDADHYGLEKVKKRITEYIAVRSLKKDMKGPILCLLGPPGVGKTSLGKSIALATNRKFERVALGGVHDESEIRGHRKTYIGAMPGCILNALRHAESKNPVMLLDEVDKIGKDFRGDPSSALLEVLDPHQNNTFTDHYLNVPFDLSNVLFIATANSLETIPAPLLDRMEIIDVAGYSVEQKMEIAKRYLFPRQIQENGLPPDMVQIADDVLRTLIMNYTREAGVRNLERQVAAICRFVAVTVVNRMAVPETETAATSFKPTVVDQALLEQILGHPLVFNEVALRSSVPGVATGMSWSSVGGSILFVEASCTRVASSPSAAQLLAHSTSATALPRLHLTGKLGDVMKESAQLALSWLRANIAQIEIPAGRPKRFISLDGISDVHVHFPEGAISKDGPSAGGAIVCAMLSVISGVPVPADIAMTGEITLRGVMLPIGGVREKVLAAVRAGIKRVILPKGNEHEAEELRKEFALAGRVTSDQTKTTEEMQLLFVSDLKELVKLVFGMTVHPDDPHAEDDHHHHTMGGQATSERPFSRL